MLNFLPLIINSVTIGLSFLLLSIQQSYHLKQVMLYVSDLDCIFQCFYEYHSHYLSIQ